MLKYIETGDKTSCYGCTACTASCAFGAITLKPDGEGFLYPSINTDVCTSCGACLRACPYDNDSLFNQDNQQAFAVQANDDDVLMDSASGAAFALFGYEVLKKGGWVCGCVFTDDFRAIHIVTNKVKDFRRMFGSKYVQSDLGDCFTRIKELLRKGEQVLFSGTPCQVAGLRAFLGKEYANLLTVDLICHGVPSQQLLNEYLNDKRKSGPVIELAFRDKRSNGWCSNGTIGQSRSGKISKKRTSPYNDTYYHHYYLANSVSRECCYSCSFSRPERVGDVTIGDYWNANEANLSFEYSRGTSAVIVNSQRGLDLVKAIQFEAFVEKTSFEQVVTANGNLSSPCERPIERDTIYKAIELEGYSVASKRFCKLKPLVPILSRLVPKCVKSYIRRMRNAI